MMVKEMTVTMEPTIRQVLTVSNDGDDGGDGGGEDGDGGGYNAEDHTSYGTGCRRKSYVYDSFEGSFCSAHKVKETIDYLDTFNENMGSLTCTQIYDESSYYYNYMNGGGDDDGTSPLAILSQSHSCSVDIYPNDCVDPYGLKHKYAKALRNAVANEQVTAVVGVVADRGLKWTTWILFVVGFVLLVSTCYLRHLRRKISNPKAEEKYMSSLLSSPEVFLREVSSTVSQTAVSIKESIQEYADEEKDLPPTTAGDYVVPAEEPADASIASAQGEDKSKVESNEPAPQELLVDKGEASLPPPAPTTSSGKQYKRPVLHKISKKLFSSKKSNLQDADA